MKFHFLKAVKPNPTTLEDPSMAITVAMSIGQRKFYDAINQVTIEYGMQGIPRIQATNALLLLAAATIAPETKATLRGSLRVTWNMVRALVGFSRQAFRSFAIYDGLPKLEKDKNDREAIAATLGGKVAHLAQQMQGVEEPTRQTRKDLN